jgi:hypothetical protein
MQIYYKTQHEALIAAYATVEISGQYEIEFPERIWTEEVNYECQVKYHLPLRVRRTGNPAKKMLHISLYRQPSGNYELTTYLA